MASACPTSKTSFKSMLPQSLLCQLRGARSCRPRRGVMAQAVELGLAPLAAHGGQGVAEVGFAGAAGQGFLLAFVWGPAGQGQDFEGGDDPAVFAAEAFGVEL